jgi:hypothetical protein
MTDKIEIKELPMHNQRCANGCEHSTKTMCLSNYGKPDAEYLHRCNLTNKVIYSDSVINQVGCVSYVFNPANIEYVPPKVEPKPDTPSEPEPKPGQTAQKSYNPDDYETKGEDKRVILA